MNGLAAIAGCSSAEKTTSPLYVQTNFSMMSRGTSWPSAPVRKPVSIGCDSSVLISTMSPRLAPLGMLMSARAAILSLHAGRQRDDDFARRAPVSAIRHFRDGRDHLRIVEPHARG